MFKPISYIGITLTASDPDSVEAAAQIVRDVARDSGATLVADVRKDNEHNVIAMLGIKHPCDMTARVISNAARSLARGSLGVRSRVNRLAA